MAERPRNFETLRAPLQNQRTLPAELAEKARAADDFGRALNVRTQMFYAAISLDFYNRDPQGLDTDKLVAQLQERYTPFKYVEGTHMQTAFGHLNGYSAVYYTYMWSLVIAKDMFTEFKKDGLLNPEVAAKYRTRFWAPAAPNQPQTWCGFSGTPVFVPGVCGLVEREIRSVVGPWSLVVGQKRGHGFHGFSRIRPYFLSYPCKSVKSVADVVLANDQRRPTTNGRPIFSANTAAHTPAPASSDPAGDH